MILKFTVPGAPYGKGRPRIGKVGAHARMFTPEKTANYEGLITLCAHAAMAGHPPFTGAAQVQLEILCQVPASWSKKKQALALDSAIFPTTKPDADNVVKAIFDGMNGVVWRDDVQAVDLSVVKRYGAAPGVNVTVWELA